MLNLLYQERCRGCGTFVLDQKQGPFCVCLDCWGQHARCSPSIEISTTGAVALPIASGTCYSGVLKKMIYRLKYDKDQAVLRDLLPLCVSAYEVLRLEARELGDAFAQPLLVPVPLHWMRMLTRGFNQAEFLAQGIARQCGGVVDTRLLSRRRSTKAQHGLGKEQRAINVSGAFRVNRWHAKGPPPPVVLVDDICTSGATLAEAAQQLHAHGFTCLFAVTAARARLGAGLDTTGKLILESDDRR